MWVYDFQFCFFRFVELPYARVKKDILRIDLLQGFVLIKDSDTAANVMITMQEKMLGNRKCACLIIDVRSCRSMFYCWFGAFVIFLIVDNILKMKG